MLSVSTRTMISFQHLVFWLWTVAYSLAKEFMAATDVVNNSFETKKTILIRALLSNKPQSLKILCPLNRKQMISSCSLLNWYTLNKVQDEFSYRYAWRSCHVEDLVIYFPKLCGILSFFCLFTRLFNCPAHTI